MEIGPIEKLLSELRERRLTQEGREGRVELTFHASEPQARVKLDAVIKLDSRIIGVFEFKNASTLDRIGGDADALRRDLLSLVPLLRFYVVTDGVRFHVFDQFNSTHAKEVDFEGLCSILTAPPNETRLKDLKGIVAEELNMALRQDPNLFNAEQSIAELSVPNYTADDIEFEPSVISFRLRGARWDTKSLENMLFYHLLPERKNNRLIHRYGSLEMVFSTLSNNTFRMNGVAGMNDRSEVDYVERYLKITGGVGPKSHYKTVEKFNQRFISSCSMKADDLTQWRLYANDSKGACLVFRVVSGSFPGAQLRAVAYANDQDRHPELDAIAAWIRGCNKANLRVMLQTLDNWSSFFKPKEYSIEKEIRLLFLDDPQQRQKPYKKRGWGLTSTHKILNPYVEFILNLPGFSIELDKIVLGPNCPEQELNKLQFQQLIREKRQEEGTFLGKVRVEVSAIKNYR